jgi:hypothetical protein
VQWKRGVDLARGDFVWIAEADDLSCPEFLETVLPGFDDPDAVLSYCESKQIDHGGRVLAENYHDYVADLGLGYWKNAFIRDGTDEIRSHLAVKNTIPNVSAVVMRREELARVLNDNIEEIRYYQVVGDWKTYLNLLPGKRLAFFPQPLNLHRRHERGVTVSSDGESHFREIQETQEWVAGRYALSPTVTLSVQRYLETLREHFGYHGNKNKATSV